MDYAVEDEDSIPKPASNMGYIVKATYLTFLSFWLWFTLYMTPAIMIYPEMIEEYMQML